MKIEFKQEQRPAAPLMTKIKLRPTLQQFQRWYAGSVVGLKPGEFPAIIQCSDYVVPRSEIKERNKAIRAQDPSYQVTGTLTLNMTPETKDKIEKASRKPQVFVSGVKLDEEKENHWYGATVFSLANVSAFEMTEAQKAEFKKQLEEYWNR